MAEKFILSELCRYPLGTFAEIIYRNALFQPDDEAFVIGSRRETFSSFNARVNRLIHGLNDSGCVKGDVLGILSWNCLEYMEVWGAAMKGGFVLAHLSPRLSENEIFELIAHTGARVLFCGPEFAKYADRFKQSIQGLDHCFVFKGDSDSSYQKLLEGQSAGETDIDLTPEDPVTIFFTSGTTGTPKGAVYSHRKKIDNSIGKALDIGVHNGDRNFIVLPMFHVGGDSHIWPFFIRGCCNVIMEKTSFDPASMLKTIQDEKITDVQIVPTQLVALLNHPRIDQYDLSSLKRIWYAASPMPTEVLKRGINMFGPIFMQGYGLSESGPHTTWLPKEAHLEKGEKVLASCGRPCSGVHMKVVDVNDHDVPPGEMGEIIVNSSRVMSGYWGQSDEDSGKGLKNGWLYTGDVGYYDEHGYIYIADRKNDMIVTGGENVYPKEVEEILYQHPSIYEAAVIGAPDSYWVERVHAMVVLREGKQATEADIISFCKERIARFKTPKSVEFIEELPKSPQGKVLKRELRKQYSESS
ncbi:MAG: long-chain-fatty-acid--CoA ligase [Desulfobacteraceae bacterium]|nr:long-chain-fatty-acid--CoA ligase [Desulfobacteraceae bacterium]